LWDRAHARICSNEFNKTSDHSVWGDVPSIAMGRSLPEGPAITEAEPLNRESEPKAHGKRVLHDLFRRRGNLAISTDSYKRPKGSRSFEAMTSIDQRPAEVDQRLVPGHWEGDLIKGKLNRSRVGVLVERTTLYVALVKLSDGSAPTTAAGFASILNRFDAHMRRSMTYDQGAEMACHRVLTEKADVEVYFAHPHSPWERGICENTNGLLRQYLPKGQDLSVFSQEQLNDIALQLNARIRKSLGWKAPAELFLSEGAFDFQKYQANTINNVALGA